MENKLPTIDIADILYQIDLKNNKLLPLDKKLEEIDLRDFDIRMDEDFAYYGYYDIHTRKMFVPEDDITEMPPNLIGVCFPHASILDPVTFIALHEAQAYICDLDNIIHHHTAEVVPIEQTELPIQIQENKLPDIDMNKQAPAKKNGVTPQNPTRGKRPGKKRRKGI